MSGRRVVVMDGRSKKVDDKESLTVPSGCSSIGFRHAPPALQPLRSDRVELGWALLASLPQIAPGSGRTSDPYNKMK